MYYAGVGVWVQTLYSVLCRSPFDTNYSYKSSRMHLYKLCTPGFVGSLSLSWRQIPLSSIKLHDEGLWTAISRALHRCLMGSKSGLCWDTQSHSGTYQNQEPALYLARLQWRDCVEQMCKPSISPDMTIPLGKKQTNASLCHDPPGKAWSTASESNFFLNPVTVCSILSPFSTWLFWSTPDCDCLVFFLF